MFSRILYSNQSPKKSRQLDTVDFNNNAIVQTSSDEECSQVLMSSSGDSQFKSLSRQLPPKELQQSNTSDSITLKHQLSQVACSSEISGKRNDESLESKNMNVLDLCSSSDTEDQSSSSIGLFEKESDCTQLLKTKKTKKDMNDRFQVIGTRIDGGNNESKLDSTKKSYKRSFSVPNNAHQSTSSSGTKRWKRCQATSKLSELPHISPLKMHSLPSLAKSNHNTKYDFDIYDYTPSYSNIAIRNPVKQSFSDWFSQSRGSCLCLLLGPAGSGKRSLLKSFCNEKHLEIISWNGDSVSLANSSSFSRYFASFYQFLQSARRYINSTSLTDSIHDCCKQIVLIDALPVTLHSSYQTDSRFLQDRLAFRQLIEELSQQPRKEESRLYVWIVDTVNELKGLSSIRFLVPRILSLPVESIVLNPPGIQLCTKMLKELYPGLSPAVMRKIIEGSHGDLRQCCMKCWVFGREICNPAKTGLLLDQSKEDSFWGLFHMIKKILLAKRTSEGELENDFDAMFINNAISLQETTSYLYANLPDYCGDIEELADVCDAMVLSETMGTKGVRHASSSIQYFDEKGNDSFDSLLDRLRFSYMALSVAVYNTHPTSKTHSFSELKSSSLHSLLSTIHSNRITLYELFNRFVNVYSPSVSFKKFILDYLSVISMMNDQGEKKRLSLVDIQEFVSLASMMIDMDDLSLLAVLELEEDPIVD